MARLSTVAAALSNTTQLLAAHSSSPRLDAELLLQHTLHVTRAYLYAHPEAPLTPAQNTYLMELSTRRKVGEPLAYILQHAAFWNLELEITPATLVPRPETELLVEWALTHLPATEALTIADLGTGSGAIALALAQERPHWQLYATDQSSAALTVAQRNAQRLGLTNIHFRQGDWCSALPPQRFHAIISNPPYIALSESHWRQGGLQFEPPQALIAGEDGLAALRVIIQQAADYLITSGWLLLEHGYCQRPAVTALLQQAGYQSIHSHQDFAGHWRITTSRQTG